MKSINNGKYELISILQKKKNPLDYGWQCYVEILQLYSPPIYVKNNFYIADIVFWRLNPANGKYEEERF